MEKQHWSKQPQPPLSVGLRQPIQTSKAAFSLSKHGWALSLVMLAGAWVVVLVIAITAVSGLLSPSASISNHTSGAATIRETTETTRASRQARIPLWLFGAIALSCAAGSMLVAKQASRPPRPRKSTKAKRLPSYAANPVLETVPPLPPPPPSPPAPPTPHYPTVAPSFVLHPRQAQQASTDAKPSMASPTLMQLAHQDAYSTVKPIDAVTVVPFDDKQPLDWGEASLADKLAIRKQRSISSLL